MLTSVYKTRYSLFFLIYFFFACTSQKVIERVVVEKGTTSSNSSVLNPTGNKNDIHKQLQKLINESNVNVVSLTPGDYYISKSLIIPTGKTLDGNQANLYFTGKDVAIILGEQKICWRAAINNLTIYVNESGAKGIDASWGRACTVDNCVISLKNTNQTAIYLKGKNGKSPYQNIFSRLYISGNHSDNQTGIKLADGGGAAHASGPNRNIFSDIKQIATLTTAVDIESGDGNIFSQVNTENITDFHFKLNDRPPLATFNATGGTLASIEFKEKLKLYSGQVKVISGTNAGFTSRVIFIKGQTIALERPADQKFDASSRIEFYDCKASNNIINNTATESRGTSVFAKMCLGAISNVFTNNYITSISSINFIRECEDNSNRIGQENYLVFNLSKNSKTKRKSVTPKSGFIMPYNGYISGVTISGSNVSKKGNTEVVLKRSGLPIKDLKTRLINNKNISSTSYLKKFDSSSMSYVKAGQQVAIELLTDNDWNNSSEIMVGILLTRI